jgi:hypothetical protein
MWVIYTLESVQFVNTHDSETYTHDIYLDVRSVNIYIVFVDVGKIYSWECPVCECTWLWNLYMCVFISPRYSWITANIGVKHQSINQYIYIVYLDVRLLGQSTFHPPVQQMQIHPQSFIQPQKQRFVKKCIINIKFSVHHMFVE